MLIDLASVKDDKNVGIFLRGFFQHDPHLTFLRPIKKEKKTKEKKTNIKISDA